MASWRVGTLLVATTLLLGATRPLAAAQTNKHALTADEVADLTLRADSGDVVAQNRLGAYYSEGPEATRDMAKAWDLARRAAEAGDAEGQRRLGRLYDFIDPEHGDSKQAAHWYALAVAQGDAVAQNNLGMLYLRGDGVERDRERGLALLKQATAQGYGLAHRNLAEIYEDGEYGVAANVATAIAWLEKGASAGDADCCTILGIRHHNGDGVPRDPARAVPFFQKGARLGDRDAFVWLGQVYRDGDGVARDCARARYWYRKAADAGDTGAMVNLGRVSPQGCPAATSRCGCIPASMRARRLSPKAISRRASSIWLATSPMWPRASRSAHRPGRCWRASTRSVRMRISSGSARRSTCRRSASICRPTWSLATAPPAAGSNPPQVAV